MILYGASGHGKVVFEILESMLIDHIEVWDDKPPKNFLGQKISIPNKKYELDDRIIISIGSNKIRKSVVDALQDQSKFGKAIHPTAIISKRTLIGDGTVVMAGVVINSEVKIGKHSIINTAAIIEHDCEIGNYCHISPNASLAGGVRIGDGSHVGINACVIQEINVGKWVTIGAGSVIIKDVPDYAVVVGNPGKIIKYNLK